MVQKSKESFPKSIQTFVSDSKRNWKQLRWQGISSYLRIQQTMQVHAYAVHWCLQYNSLKQNQFLTQLFEKWTYPRDKLTFVKSYCFQNFIVQSTGKHAFHLQSIIREITNQSW